MKASNRQLINGNRISGMAGLWLLLFGLCASAAWAQTLVNANFDAGTEGFTYVDDAFRSTSQPVSAEGAHLPSGGFSGGGLQVLLGGDRESGIITNMSGGWRTTVNLASLSNLQISFRYNLTQSPHYESEELSQALVTVNGLQPGTGGNDYVAQINGDGENGSPITTGWQQFTANLGIMAAGPVVVTLGGFNNQKSYINEETEILIDDVVLTASAPGGILREAWTGISGTSISNLTSNSNYPDNPNVSEFLSILEAPTNWGDNYGTRLRGYITPPTTGNYTFWIASDDNSELWLSTTVSPGDASLIANISGWTGPREWEDPDHANQQSAPIPLVGGQKYYIEVLQKEGSGDDNLAVGWQGPGITGDTERPIPGSRLSPWTGTPPVDPPTITSQPSHQIVGEGQTATFSVAASGEAPLSYQWRKDGTDISGATGASYTTPAVTASDDGSQYDVIVSNPGGSVTSNAAMLTVQSAPAIVTQPSSQSVAEGQTATFSVVAAGSAPLFYQWRKNGANISGATGTSYTTPAATASDDGSQYDVVVTNSQGFVASNIATLTVLTPPSIITQPANQTVNQGQTATFSVTASGSAPLAYQWRKNGTNISGATGPSYTTPPVTGSDDGATYDVVVSNAVGTITSSAASLTVLSPPVITTQPIDQSVIEGQTATFSVAVSGTSPFTYQWRKNGVNISGATSSSYTTPPTSAADEGALYSVVVTNSVGNVLSNPATLTVVSPPTITTQPANQTVIPGQSATFIVAATGTAPLSFQWRKDGAAISGATASTYVTPAATTGDDGSQYDVIVSNVAGTVTSSVATLSVSIFVPNNKMLSISGELVDENGNPVGYPSPVDLDVTVRLMNDATAGATLYTETFLAADGEAVTVEDGLFVARLGEGSTSDDLQNVISANPQLWVEITVDDGTPDVLLPRTPLTASAYSLGGVPTAGVSSPVVIQGEGDPNSLGIPGNVGNLYVNNTDQTTWIKISKGWSLIE